ncbi:MAG: hypothetical protein V7K53_06980 [Nostoc sp.]
MEPTVSITGLRNVSRCTLVCDGASVHVGDRISRVYSNTVRIRPKHL